MSDGRPQFNRNWDKTAEDLRHEARRILSSMEIIPDGWEYDSHLRAEVRQGEIAYLLSELVEKVLTLTEELSEAQADLQELQRGTASRSKHYERNQWIYDHVIGSSNTLKWISVELESIADVNNWFPVSERRIGQIAAEHAKQYNLRRPEPRKERGH